MKLVFAGTPDVAVPSLEALVESHHEVLAVITRPDAPAGRGRRLTPSPVAARAEELGLHVLKPAHPRDEDFQAQLRALAPDACAVVAYGALLPQSALDIPRHGWINLHFSLLPRWRGAAPVQRAIMAGDPAIGTATFRIVKELDAGDVYLSQSMATPEETAGELFGRLARSGATQLVQTMDLVEAGQTPTPQREDGITVAPKITVPEARIDWTRGSEELRNHILGCSPDPGAWCELAGERFKIYRARLAEYADLAPGEVAATKRQVFVGTGQGALELLEVQAPGKRRMSAIDWARAGVSGRVLS
ncbi:methionyl-tRNA formyltransferase [Tessaracoccus flavus]|uniref:Methionyl-tRNA formyltransferase n=1 Tax=Tessaracoccus flavus TaxID=1610493 RepID=A0A1Q2CEB4_9ACTN|nr:methionyl-tRNA formyltransferase [Tessaracoccus flavus]AQP44443.1 methionyl-tRNA formyltransferase [Tessaracoccus flavus]SDY69524.1 methionyl-tRNA formyltransferase [Tessaracoccus flavus]